MIGCIKTGPTCPKRQVFLAVKIADKPRVTHSAAPRSTRYRKKEDGERAILGGLTLDERLECEGAGFWLRLSNAQTEALKRHLRQCAERDG